MALSIDDLRSFLLVVQERSVTRAARHLEVTQQSVSERIRRLESRVGVKLFTRMPHGVQPTPAGYRLVPYAAQCVSLVDEAMAVIDDDDLIRLQVQRSASDAVMPFLENMAAASRIDITTATDAAEMLDAVAEGLIDVAVGVFIEPHGSDAQVAPAPAPAADRKAGGEKRSANGKASGADGGASEDPPNWAHASVRIEALLADPVIWVVSADHPWASRTEPLSLAELSVASAPGTGDPGGPRVVARSAVVAELASGELVELPIDQASWVVPISIAYRAADHDRPGVVTLRRAVTDGHALATARQSANPSSSQGAADA